MRLARTFLIVTLIAATAAPAFAFEAGTAGLLFLRLGVSERAAGMGDAYTALAGDATALYWNPAGLARTPSTNLRFAHHEYFQSLRQEFVGVAHPTHLGTFAFGVTALTMDDMELREGPSEEPLGHFSAFDMAFHMAWGKNLFGGVEAGVGAKWIYSRIYEESAKGMLFDFGLRHETRIPSLTVAAAVLNMGSQFEYVSETFDAPLTMKMGVALNTPIHMGDNDLLIAYDLLLVGDGDVTSDDSLGEARAMSARHHMGAEWQVAGLAALRLGYKAGYDSQNLTAGAGIALGQYRFDYAFVNSDNDLGSSHRLGLGIDF